MPAAGLSGLGQWMSSAGSGGWRTSKRTGVKAASVHGGASLAFLEESHHKHGDERASTSTETDASDSRALLRAVPYAHATLIKRRRHSCIVAFLMRLRGNRVGTVMQTDRLDRANDNSVKAGSSMLPYIIDEQTGIAMSKAELYRDGILRFAAGPARDIQSGQPWSVHGANHFGNR